MALKPAFVQQIRHGKLLSRASFPMLVDTWNWMSSALSNLRGDGDNNANGLIKVDWSRDDHPVIRFDKSRLAYSFGSCPQPWDLDFENDTFKNQYYKVGNKIYLDTKGYSLEELLASGRVLALKVTSNSATPQPLAVSYVSVNDMIDDQSEEDYTITPLYLMSGADEVLVDFRNVPYVQQFEMISSSM